MTTPTALDCLCPDPGPEVSGWDCTWAGSPPEHREPEPCGCPCHDEPDPGEYWDSDECILKLRG